MFSRFFKKFRKSPRDATNMFEHGDCKVGFMDDLELILCDYHNHKNHDGDDDHDYYDHSGDYGKSHLTLRGVLNASVCVMGKSHLGMTHKVVPYPWLGRICAVKRFWKVSIGRGEFGRRIERLVQVSSRCDYLVPVTAYLHSKRIKLLVCHYYPMGSLADLLAGSRDFGHIPLDWNQRLVIIRQIARAIAFIHSRSPSQDKHLQMNVHGNIKASNVMIGADFSAYLSDYGFRQLAERVEVSGGDSPPRKPPQLRENTYCDMLCQKSDIYNFGAIVLDMLGVPKAQGLKKFTYNAVERKEETRNGVLSDFFEFFVEGRERKQALKVLEIALACTNRSSDSRPSIEQILLYLEDVVN